MTDVFDIIVSQQEAGTRLDRLLADRLPDISRSRIKNLISDGHLSQLTDTSPIAISSVSQKVKEGDTYQLSLPEPETAEPTPQNIPIEIVFEDDYLVIVNKPAGMVVHPAPGSPDGTLVNALLHHCEGSLAGIGGVKRPGIVHRIDKETSGLLVVAKTDQAHAGLSAQFADHSCERIYTAICRGMPSQLNGRIEGNIARHPKDRKKMAITDRGGKHAVTHYRTLETYSSGGHYVASKIECQLETGRTHQVRVHMASINHPLIGDPVYGNPGRLPAAVSGMVKSELKGFKRQALHARTLGFLHPVSGKALKFSSELPNDMSRLLETLASVSKRHNTDLDRKNLDRNPGDEDYD